MSDYIHTHPYAGTGLRVSVQAKLPKTSRLRGFQKAAYAMGLQLRPIGVLHLFNRLFMAANQDRLK